jgi:hypothetical protein
MLLVFFGGLIFFFVTRFSGVCGLPLHLSCHELQMLIHRGLSAIGGRHEPGMDKWLAMPAISD